MNSEILITSDGSHTLFVPEIDECYHSTHGAIQESRHIFIETALKQHSKTELNVLEVGFGTGLNALLALVEAERSGKIIHYCTLEKYPVAVEKAFLLNYPAMIDVRYKDVFEKMHSSAWNGKVKITPFFEIEKMECDFTNFEHTSTYDIVFFDAFSPENSRKCGRSSSLKKYMLIVIPASFLPLIVQKVLCAVPSKVLVFLLKDWLVLPASVKS